MKIINMPKKIWKYFESTHLDNYRYLHVQSDKLLLGDVFKNFCNKCIEAYVIDPFLSASGLVW